MYGAAHDLNDAPSAMSGSSAPTVPLLLTAHARDMRRRGCSESSIDKRVSAVRRCADHAGKAPLDLDRDDIEAWLDARRICDRTRYHDISHLASFFAWAIREEHAAINPTARVVRPKMRVGVPRPIPTDELRHVLDQAPTNELRAMLLLASYGGLRCAEIASLNGSDVLDGHDPAVMVVHGKGRKERVVPMHPLIIDALRRVGVPSRGPVFTRDDGREVPAWKVSHELRAHMLDCGVEASAHMLRHWFATTTYDLSSDIRLVQGLLGHSSPSTTVVYAAWSQRRAAAVVGRIPASPQTTAST